MNPRLPALRSRIVVFWVACIAGLGFLPGFLPIPTIAAPPNTAPIRLESFELTDQFGHRHAVRFPTLRPMLLVIGDRRGSEEIDPWIAPLKQRWGSSADLLGIADVRAVPRFLKSRITEAIRRARPQPLLLDFEGVVTEKLPCKSKAANVFAVGTDGRILAHVHGPYLTGSPGDPKLDVLAQALASP